MLSKDDIWCGAQLSELKRSPYCSSALGPLIPDKYFKVLFRVRKSGSGLDSVIYKNQGVPFVIAVRGDCARTSPIPSSITN